MDRHIRPSNTSCSQSSTPIGGRSAVACSVIGCHPLSGPASASATAAASDDWDLAAAAVKSSDVRGQGFGDGSRGSRDWQIAGA